MQEERNQIYKYILNLLSLFWINQSRKESMIRKTFEYFRDLNRPKYSESGWICANRNR
jgi:hypothetical protein